MDLKLKNNSQLELPTKYIPVDYIESVGIPNIPLFTVSLWSNDGQSIECSIEITEEEASNSQIYYGATGSQKLGLAANNSITQFNAYGNTAVKTVEFNGKVTIKHSVTNITINDVSTSLGGAIAKVPTIYLLPQAIKTRIYYFNKIVKNNISVNYIPVISLEYGHVGEACLYDTINQTFKYSSSTGSFTASPSQTFYDTIISAYIKDCPNIDGITILRNALNLNRIRCNITNPTGRTAEIYKYTQLSGFNDAGEQQTKPRIVGTFNIDDYYTDAEVAKIRSTIDGITIVTPTASDYNIDTLLDNDGFAVQTLDEDKPEYNQPIAEILLSNNLAHSLASDDTKMFMTKTEAAAITSLPVTLFRGNTDIESFDEFKYWTGLTTITAGSSSSALGAFGNCTSLESIILPSNITTIGAYAFYNCTGLTTFTIPSSITSIGAYAFYGCYGFTGELVVPNSVTSLGANAFANTSFTKANLPKTFTSAINIINMFAGNTSIKDITVGSSGTIDISGTSCGDGTGTLEIFANVNKTGAKYMGKFKNVIIHGDCNLKSAGSLWNNVNNGITDVFRVQGTMSVGGANGGYSYISNTPYNATHLYYTELGDYSKSGSSGYFMYANDARSRASSAIVHFNRSTLPTSCPGNTVPKYKVGEGRTRADDEATLALYLADSTWSAYSAKLGTWYDYNGTYKWYYITDNLTNCTNTNPDEWPHITRGESYETTIIPDEGMTIDSITVEMLDTDTTSPTYDTYVPQPTSYDSATGIYTISIPSVTGNVVITASAS